MSETVINDLQAAEKAEAFFRGEERILSDIAGDSGFRFTRGKRWGINPLTGEATYDPQFFEDKGYTPSQALFAAFHEIKAHLVEKAEIYQHPKGEALYKRLKERSKGKKRVWRWENIRQDIKGNRAILKFAPSLAQQTEELYREKLFPISDYTDTTKFPRHVQFMDSIIRSAMVPGEEVKVSAEVADAISKLRNFNGQDIIELATNPSQDPILAMRISEKFIEPVIEELYQKDLEDKKKNQQDKKDKKTKQNKQSSSDPSQSQDGSSSDETEDENDSQSEEDEDQSADDSNDEGDNEDSSSGEEGDEDNGENDSSAQGDEPFDEYYKDYEDKHPEPMDEDEIEKKIKEFLKNNDPAKREEDAYEKEHGVKKKDVEEYLSEYKKIEPYVEELREIFRRIIQERVIVKRRLGTLKEEGIMVDPGLVVQTYLDAKSGIDNPKTMKDFEGRRVPENIPNSFSIHLVADLSGSMENSDKSVLQRQTALLTMEALTEFSQLSDDSDSEMIEELNIQTQLLGFGYGHDSAIKIFKPLSPKLTEAERIAYYKELLIAVGSTTDYLALGVLEAQFQERAKSDSMFLEDLKTGKRREIVIVMSDGGSDNPAIVADQLSRLRKMGVKVVGVGIGSESSKIETTYSPNAKVCPDPKNLPAVTGELLKEFLSDLSVPSLKDMLQSN